MRRIALVGATLAALVVLAAPAWAATPTAGHICKNSEAGLTATAGNGRTVICQYDAGINRNRWTYTTAAAPAVAATASGTTPQAAVPVFATSGDLQGTRIVSFNAGTVATTSTVRAASTLPRTGLDHVRQLVELALVFIGLGTALVIGRRPGVIR